MRRRRRRCWTCGGVGALQETLMNSTWRIMSSETKADLEDKLDCCGLFNNTASRPQFDVDVDLCKAVRIHNLGYRRTASKQTWIMFTWNVLSSFKAYKILFFLYESFKGCFTCVVFYGQDFKAGWKKNHIKLGVVVCECMLGGGDCFGDE